MLVSVWALCDVRNINIVNVLFNFVESKVIYVRKSSGGVRHIPSFSQTRLSWTSTLNPGTHCSWGLTYRQRAKSAALQDRRGGGSPQGPRSGCPSSVWTASSLCWWGSRSAHGGHFGPDGDGQTGSHECPSVWPEWKTFQIVCLLKWTARDNNSLKRKSQGVFKEETEAKRTRKHSWNVMSLFTFKIQAGWYI